MRLQDWSEVEGPLRERVRAWLETKDSPSRWPLYVVAEKILGAAEPLDGSWAVNGTSGYDFINMVNGLFVDTANADAFTQLYHDWIRDDTPFPEIVYRKKLLILQISLSSELHMLTHQLDRLAQKSRWSRDLPSTHCSRACAK